MKTCTVCKELLSYEKFYNSKQTKDGKGYRCKDCERKVVEDYKRRYREKTKEWQRDRNRKAKYGITKEQYNQLIEDQDGKCAICEDKMDFAVRPDMKTRAVVDHCHTYKTVRGLLCARCNQALGLFRDSPVILEKAITYLKGKINIGN